MQSKNNDNQFANSHPDWLYFKGIFRESSYEVIPEKVEPQDSEPVPLDAKFFKLAFKSAKKVGSSNQF